MSTEKLSDYQKALHIAVVMPRFYLGQEVETKDGKGIIVKLEMDFNGLYISPERSRAIVWFSTKKAFLDGTKWVNASYSLSELNG
jgi:hypothetical protein